MTEQNQYQIKKLPAYIRVRTLDEVSGGAKVRTLSEVNGDVRVARLNYIIAKNKARGN